MKQYANQKRTFHDFAEGDYVYLRLQPYRYTKLKKTQSEKLAPRPFKIVKKIGELNYELDLPSTTRMHRVFHVSLLKRSLGEHLSATATLPPLDYEGNMVLEPAKIVRYRDKVLRNGKLIKEYLIHWKNLPDEDNSWVNSSFIQKWPRLLP
ncbi:hypothetical protein O6H91_21G020300 [Diphasiastrum complanatum]|uniref:Uncharacterized protein n=1 Tax=Diphasiastrum complanatum TaxID=34168 RepID=A0ACC2AIG8_DIPCM|nr:hypothetical protein O6H91_21G020300 [Diphasiastrum complanatum]